MTANHLLLCPLPTPRTSLVDKSALAIDVTSGCCALPITPDPWVKPTYSIPSMSLLLLASMSRGAKQVLTSDGWLSVLNTHTHTHTHTNTHTHTALCSWNLRVSSVWATWHLLAPVWKRLKFCSTSTADTKSGMREALFKILRLTENTSLKPKQEGIQVDLDYSILDF